MKTGGTLYLMLESIIIMSNERRRRKKLTILVNKDWMNYLGMTPEIC